MLASCACCSELSARRWLGLLSRPLSIYISLPSPPQTGHDTSHLVALRNSLRRLEGRKHDKHANLRRQVTEPRALAQSGPQHLQLTLLFQEIATLLDLFVDHLVLELVCSCFVRMRLLAPAAPFASVSVSVCGLKLLVYEALSYS